VATAVVTGVVLATPVMARAATGTPVAVQIHQYQFHPDPLTVEVGQPVTWTNEDSAAHDVTSSSGPVPFASGSLATGQSFTVTFDQPGTYAYLCTVHPDMVGTVTVDPAPTTTSPPTTVTAGAGADAGAAAGPSTTVTTPPSAAGSPAPPAVGAGPVSVGAAAPIATTAPGFAHAVRPLAVLLALVAAVVAGCLLLLGVGRAAPVDEP
jgi:plastocyanin